MKRDMLKSHILAIVVIAMMLSAPLVGLVIPSDDVDASIPSYDVYYDSLSADGKKVYDALVAHAESESFGDLTVTMMASNPSSDDIGRAFQAFIWEQPQYFWIRWMDDGGSYSDNTLTIPLEYIGPIALATDKSAKLAELKSKVKESVDGYVTSGRMTYELIKGFHDRMINDCSYDTSATLSEGYDNAYNILGVFVDGEAVCQGYSMAMKYLCDKAGVPCINVSGTSYSNNGSGPHMWNYIMMDDGLWYCMDVTWDDPTVIGGGEMLLYDNFLVGSDTVNDERKFIESHVPLYEDHLDPFTSAIPAINKDVPWKLSKDPYHLRPGSESEVVYEIGDAGDSPFNLTRVMIDPDDSDNILNNIGPDGKGVIIAGNITFILTMDAIEQIFAEMKSEGTDLFTFGCVIENREFTDVFDKMYHKNVYAPFILNNGVPIEDLDDVGEGIDVEIGIPYEMAENDIELFLLVWGLDYDDEGEDMELSPIWGSKYNDGMMTYRITDSFEDGYVITSNPFGNFSFAWVLVVLAVALILAIVVIVTIIVVLFKIIRWVARR